MVARYTKAALTKARPLLSSFPAVLILVLVVTLALVHVTSAQRKPDHAGRNQAATERLQAQVETSTGEPRPGRDPSSQQQNSLAAAASQSAGAGQRSDKPAAGLQGERRQVDPSEVLPDSKKTGILSNGCLADYGKPGEECVPAHLVHHQHVSCDDVREIFPDGVQVTGTDRYHLDRNHNKVACDSGDR